MDSDDAERIARNLTPALAKQLQAELRQLKFDGSGIAGSPADWQLRRLRERAVRSATELARAQSALRRAVERAAKIDPRDQQL